MILERETVEEFYREIRRQEAEVREQGDTDFYEEEVFEFEFGDGMH